MNRTELITRRSQVQILPPPRRSNTQALAWVFVLYGRVNIGAFAAFAQNVSVPPTMDIDFYTAQDQTNLERLSKALDFLEANIRAKDLEAGIAFDIRRSGQSPGSRTVGRILSRDPTDDRVTTRAGSPSHLGHEIDGPR